MNLNEVKTLLAGTIKQAFTNKKTLDRFEDTTGTLKYNGVPVNNAPVFVADDSPVGNIISFMGNSAPQDYLICDGAEYQIADYPLLVQHFINEFGSANYFGGDGEATFAVPDLRGEFLRGTGTATRNVGSGANVGEHQDGTELQQGFYAAASGKIQIYGIPNARRVLVANDDKKIMSNQTTLLEQTFSATQYSEVSLNTLVTTRPTNTSVLYCIKYQITQNNISKDMVNYSLEEQVIGSWIDGKPLYQKTIITTAPETTTDGIQVQKTIDLSSLDIDFLTKSEGTVVSDTTIHSYPPAVSYVNSTNSTAVLTQWYVKSSKMLTISNNYKSYNNRDIYVTIQYTKTTDAENSFTPEMLSNISSFNTTVTDEDVSDVIGGI